MTILKKLKKGDFFTMKKVENPDENQVWIRGGYYRNLKKYVCVRFDDSCKFRYISGDEKVFTDFFF